MASRWAARRRHDPSNRPKPPNSLVTYPKVGISSNDSAPLPATDEKWHPDEKGYQEYGDNGEDDDDNDDDDDDEEEEEEENAHRLRSAPMQGGRASLWRLVPPTDMKAEEVDEATPKMLTRISKWQKG